MKEAKAKRVRKSTLVSEIAQDTLVRPEVVEAVLSRYHDLLVEKIVNGENVVIANVCSISPYTVSNVVVPQAKGSKATVSLGEQKRIRLRLSPNLKKLYRFQQDESAHKPYLVDRDSWRAALAWLLRRDGEKKADKKEEAPDGLTTSYYNAFVEDHD